MNPLGHSSSPAEGGHAVFLPGVPRLSTEQPHFPQGYWVGRGSYFVWRLWGGGWRGECCLKTFWTGLLSLGRPRFNRRPPGPLPPTKADTTRETQTQGLEAQALVISSRLTVMFPWELPYSLPAPRRRPINIFRLNEKGEHKAVSGVHALPRGLVFHFGGHLLAEADPKLASSAI